MNRNAAPTKADLYEHFRRYVPNMLLLVSERIAEVNARGCWIWRGRPTAKMGYGLLSLGPRDNQLIIYAHRMSFMVHCGDPGELSVLHSCDTPLCFNPAHLFRGTSGDNVRDAVAKGRHRNQNTGRTHCRKGHLLAGDNVRLEAGRFRRCLTCQRLGRK